MGEKFRKDIANLSIEKMSALNPKKDKPLLEQLLGDVSKKSAATQLIIGASSGILTGYVGTKVGKAAALAIGGSIILLQVANEQGLIKIDWNKVTQKVDKVQDRVEEAVTGESTSWMNKAERYVDRKLDRAEETLKKKQKSVKTWYSSLVGDETGPKLNKLHIFLAAFAGGLAITKAITS